jgi:PAS domain S-box-containing protein
MRLSLAAKLTFFMGGAMASIVLFIAFTVAFYLQKSLEQADHELCLNSAGYLARYIRAPLISDKYFQMHQLFEDSVSQGIFYKAALLDNEGKVLMHTDLGEVGKVYDDVQTGMALYSDKPYFKNHELSGSGFSEDVLYMPVSAAGTRLGTLCLSHSHKQIEETFGTAKMQVLIFGAFVILISLLFFNFLGSLITRPVRKLTRAIRRVAAGEFGLTVDEKRNDEIGELAKSFNTMTSELRSTTVSYDYLNNIFNSAGDAIRTINLDYEVGMNNRSMADLMNLQHLEISLEKCHEYMNFSICNTESCVLRRILNGEKTVQLTTEMRLYDGRKKHVRLVATPLLENDEVAGVIESVQDITGQKIAEEESSSLQGQLIQAQKMESVGRLAGGVAHDFNNILSVIIGYSELGLLKSLPGNPLNEKLLQIKDAARRAEDLVRQLLAFSRKQVLEKRVLDLNEVILNMMRMLSRIIGEDIKLEVALQDSPRKILADQSQLVQVLMNLAVNARDAMPNGGKFIIKTADIDVRNAYGGIDESPEPGHYVLLSVSDTGIGMSDKVVKNIFEPFFTTKGPEAGTGLGLSTVYGTIKQHGGHIDVHSEQGVGTTFDIYLPVTEREDEATSACEDFYVRQGNETILIVDDEEAIRELLAETLQGHGYRVFESPDGEKALELIVTKNLTIDVLLTDIVMPVMNGRDLARHISALFPDAVIIFMSGYSQKTRIQDIMDSQPAYFIQKPVTPRLLFEKLREALDSPGHIEPHAGEQFPSQGH